MKKIVIAGLLTLAIASMMLAQGQRRGGPGGPGGPPAVAADGTQRQGPDPSAALKAALDLNDAQVASIKLLMETRQQRAQAIQTEIGQKRQALDALVGAVSPNASDVGNAYLALRASEKKMEGERDWFITELKKLLTGSQQATLDNLIKAGAPIPGLGGPGMGGPRGRGGPRPQGN